MDYLSVFQSFEGIAIGKLSLASLLSAIVLLLVCYIVIRIAMKLLGRGLERSKLSSTLRGYVLTAAKAVMWVIAAIIIADSLHINTTSLVAALSVVGLALSLSIQNLLANLFSGLTLLVTHPFKDGDLVDIGSRSGTVKSVGLFYTVVDTLDNKLISIPNSDVTSSSVVNYSSEPLRRVDLTYTTSYDSAQKDVRAAIAEAIELTGKVIDTPAPPFVEILSYGESSIEYVVRLWVRSEDYWDVYFGMNANILDCFKKHNVEMSYNHLNVHMIKD